MGVGGASCLQIRRVELREDHPQVGVSLFKKASLVMIEGDRLGEGLAAQQYEAAANLLTESCRYEGLRSHGLRSVQRAGEWSHTLQHEACASIAELRRSTWLW